jgi:hypothetical protein
MHPVDGSSSGTSAKKEQLAAHQLSKDLLFVCTGPSIVVWGNGGFGPISHGHAPAHNKRLRRLLSYSQASMDPPRGVLVVIQF